MCYWGKSVAEARQTLNRIRANRAGIRADDRQRRIAHKERILLQIFKVLEHLEEHAVIGHDDVVEGLDVRLAVLDGHAVAEADALDLVVAHPVCGFRVDKQALIW